MRKSGSSNLLLIGAAAVAAWYFLTRGSTLNSLQFIPRGIGLQGTSLNLSLGILNPTNNSLRLSSVVGSLNVQGSPVGTVTSFQPVDIAPNSETDINLLITGNVFGLLGGVINHLNGNEGY